MKTIPILILLLSLSISCTNGRHTPQQTGEPTVSEVEAEPDKKDTVPSEGGVPNAGTCLGEGEGAPDSSARFPGEAPPVCCEGLDRILVYEGSSFEQGKCIVSKGDLIVCARCGDGVCGPGENRCNCSDCE